MKQEQSLKIAYRLCAALAFAIAVFGMVRSNLQAAGSLYLPSDDGDLYLSVARNLLENAHFIQTARLIEAFVVPPGLPAICALLLYLTGGISQTLLGSDMAGLLFFQYAVYGAAAALLACTALRLALGAAGEDPQEETAAKPSDLSYAHTVRVFLALCIGAAAAIFYLHGSFLIRHPNPGFILTENYVLFFIALALWLLVSDAKETALCAVCFVLMLFRPACSGLFALSFLWLLARASADRFSGQRPPAGERISLFRVLTLSVIFALILAVNVAVNRFETGEIIVLEDYSSMDLYLANNEKAGPEWYHSGLLYEFASPRYKQIYDNTRLTRYEQNALAKKGLLEYISAETETVIRNAAIRFDRMYRQTWDSVWYAFLASLLLLLFWRGLRLSVRLSLLAAAVLLAVPPAFGLLVARYTAPMLPLFAALTLGAAGCLLRVMLLGLAPKERRPLPVPVQEAEEEVE